MVGVGSAVWHLYTKPLVGHRCPLHTFCIQPTVSPTLGPDDVLVGLLLAAIAYVLISGIVPGVGSLIVLAPNLAFWVLLAFVPRPSYTETMEAGDMHLMYGPPQWATAPLPALAVTFVLAAALIGRQTIWTNLDVAHY